MKGIKFLLILTVASFVISCGEYEALAIEKESKRIADSLFRAHRDSLDKMADGICDSIFNEYYNQALDSLKNTQLKKIKDLIQK